MRYEEGGGSAADAQAIMASMARFADVANSGGFEVSPEGGQALIDAIDEFQDWAAGQVDNLRLLVQQRKLGTSSAAKVIAPFMPQVASDGEGFVTQLQALRESLDKAKDGIKTAMANYQRTEEANAASLKNIQT